MICTGGTHLTATTAVRPTTPPTLAFTVMSPPVVHVTAAVPSRVNTTLSPTTPASKSPKAGSARTPVPAAQPNTVRGEGPDASASSTNVSPRVIVHVCLPSTPSSRAPANFRHDPPLVAWTVSDSTERLTSNCAEALAAGSSTTSHSTTAVVVVPA